MKTTTLHLLTSTAILMLAQFCQAQQIDGSSSGSVVDNKPKITNRASPAGDAETWRMVNHNGNWWYYHPNGSWSSWNGTRWNAYRGGANTSTPAANSNAATPKGDSGDVEQSGAELGLGSGPNYASGLAPRGIGATVNGKGAPPMGGTAR